MISLYLFTYSIIVSMLSGGLFQYSFYQEAGDIQITCNLRHKCKLAVLHIVLDIIDVRFFFMRIYTQRAFFYHRKKYTLMYQAR